MVKNKAFRDFHRYIAVYFLCKNQQHFGANWSQWANIFNQVPFSNLWEPIGHKWDNIFNQVPFSNLWEPIGHKWDNNFNQVPFSNHWELIGHNSQISLLPNQYHKVPKIAGSNFIARSRPGHELGNSWLAGFSFSKFKEVLEREKNKHYIASYFSVTSCNTGLFFQRSLNYK